MTPIEATQLARYISAHFPQQPIDEYTSEALAELLAPYPASDARTAVLNIAERGEHWCAPTAVKAEVKTIRAKRLMDHGPIDPPPGLDPDDTDAYRRWLDTTRRAIANGQPPPTLEPGPRRDVAALGQAGHPVDA